VPARRQWAKGLEEVLRVRTDQRKGAEPVVINSLGRPGRRSKRTATRCPARERRPGRTARLRSRHEEADHVKADAFKDQGLQVANPDRWRGTATREDRARGG